MFFNDTTTTKIYTHSLQGALPIWASIAMYIASKAWALMKGRNYVIPKDVKDISHFVLRHRIILNYKARAEKMDSDQIIDEILGMIDVV